jgi:transcriptional regulator with XRE-family HTH domain
MILLKSVGAVVGAMLSWLVPYRSTSIAFRCPLERTRLPSFGEMVRTLRRQTGLTGVELARRVEVSQSRISRIETGHIAPQPDEVNRLADALGADASTREQLQDQARAARSSMRSWRALHARGFAQHQTDIARREQAATRVRMFQPNLVPGLLQTAEYARHAIELSTESQDAELGVARRMARQSILYERGKTFEFLITEGALKWRIVPTNVHVGQLNHVASLATLANVSIGVIPWHAQVGAHQSTMFCLFDEASAYVELLNGEVTTEDHHDVAQYAAAFTALTQAAVTGDDAIAELRRIASELAGLA